MIGKHSNVLELLTTTTVFLLCCLFIHQKSCARHNTLIPSRNGQNVSGVKISLVSKTTRRHIEISLTFQLICKFLKLFCLN